jgi:hypothetical protein
MDLPDQRRVNESRADLTPLRPASGNSKYGHSPDAKQINEFGIKICLLLGCSACGYRGSKIARTRYGQVSIVGFTNRTGEDLGLIISAQRTVQRQHNLPMPGVYVFNRAA